MEIGDLINSLDITSRQIFLSCALAFPVSYIDLWKLYEPFRTLEWFPQTMLALGTSVMFVGLGYILSIFFQPRMPKNEAEQEKFIGLNIISILFVFVAASISMFFGGTLWNPLRHFTHAYLVFGGIYMVFGVINNISYYSSKKNQQHEPKHITDDLPNET